MITKESALLYRIIVQSNGMTMTAETAKAVTLEVAEQIAEKDLMPPNVAYKNYVLQPICTERQWKYGQINFCPRCGKHILFDSDIGGEDDRIVTNVQEFDCPECDAEIVVDITRTREQREDPEDEE